MKVTMEEKREMVLKHLMNQIGPLAWRNCPRNPMNVVAKDFFNRTVRLKPMSNVIRFERLMTNWNSKNKWNLLASYPVTKLYAEII